MGTMYSRVDERTLNRKLQAMGAVVIEGPRFCGKSTLALKMAKSDVRLDESPALLELAKTDPHEIFAGAAPRLIDEWQLAPVIWNSLRHEIDQRKSAGQFILTGSSTPADDVARHSGAGRIGRVRMRTMSLFESRLSEAKVDFASLFDKAASKSVAGYGGLSVRDYCGQIVRGGWPALANVELSQAVSTIDDYVDNIAHLNVSASDSKETNPQRIRDLLTALSRNIATNATNTKLSAEAKIASLRTTTKYLDKLSSIFILEELPAWRPHIRSSIRSKVSPKWHFADPSIAASQLNLSVDKLLADLKTAGFFFESLAVRDLRVYASALGGEVSYYRDSSGLEVDAIVQLRDGRWAAFEVKLGDSARIKSSAASLAKLKVRLAQSELQNLASLNIITGGNTSYHDAQAGVNVISLGHLYV